MQPLSQVLKHCFDEFRDIAILLDRESGEDSHLKAVQHFQACIDSPEQLLSAQYDRHLYCVGHYTEAGMLLAKQHKDTLTASPLSPETLKIFQEQVVKSFQ
jgi:gamma-glutamylcysteine synthetase